MTVSLVAMLSTFGDTSSEALVISPPFGNSNNQGVATIPSVDGDGEAIQQTATISRHRSIRIRSTTESDTTDIAHFLATSLMEQEATTGGGGGIMGGFKAQIELLKTKSGVESLIGSRIRVMEMAKTVYFPHLDRSPQQQMNEADALRYIWSNHDSFRNKIEHAAKLSNEPHIWKDHNFACAPDNGQWFQHKMLTAVDARSGEVVGFCELAMISKPSSSQDSAAADGDDDDHDDDIFAPTILNLATAPQHRRKGIATRLLHTACRFVQQEWKESTELTLYVQQDNQAAIALYEALGFGDRQAVDRNGNQQYYMAKPLGVLARA